MSLQDTGQGAWPRARLRHSFVFVLCAALAFGAHAADAPYTAADFDRIDKIDAHVHLHGDPSPVMARAHADRMRLLEINVDYPDFPPLATQRAQAVALAAAHPHELAWVASLHIGTGDVDDPGWTSRANADLDATRALGAVGLKVWKDVGFSVRDRGGHLVMLDDPRLDPLFDHLASTGLPLLGHQGEPQNAWLPLDRMTLAGDRAYFAGHPEYHLARHPEIPGRDAQLAARDARLARTPALHFVGLHLASLEADLDALAAFLDRFPQASVDLAARLPHLELAASTPAGRQRVRAFLLRYQDRVLYGTDLTLQPADDARAVARDADHDWRADWRFLATAARNLRSAEFPARFDGLALPREVVDKLYRLNALREFPALR